MFTDDDQTDQVITRMRRVGTRTARAGIFSPGREKEAEHLFFQEFGAPAANIPQRQTVAPAFDQAEDDVVDLVARGVDATLGGAPGDTAAEAVAEHLDGAIRAKIESNVGPPLKPATLANRRRRIRVDREGVVARGGRDSTSTLIDAGDMLASVEHDVISGEGSDG